MKKWLYLSFFLLLCSLTGISQRTLEISAGIGSGVFLEEKLVGMSYQLAIQKPIAQKWGVSISLNACLSETKGLFSEIEQLDHAIHSVEHVPGYRTIRGGTGGGTYTGFHFFDTKPNKMYYYGVSVQAWYLLISKKKHLLRAGLGAGGNYLNLMHIDFYVEGSFQDPIFPEEIVENSVMPIFRYQSYFDLSVVSSAEYQFSLKEQLSLGMNIQYSYAHSSKVALLFFQPIVVCYF